LKEAYSKFVTGNGKGIEAYIRAKEKLRKVYGELMTEDWNKKIRKLYLVLRYQ
jgi:hypothetical protein